MLSPASLSIVRQTLPAVGAAIPEVTALFYDRLFADHPRLLSDLFNRGNQANGSQQQALAGSIARFASVVVTHPDQDPRALLGRVAHKHASLGVTAEQYDLVHTYLFAAIADVLGSAATAEVATAWDELYWLMAHTLIDLEADLYRASGNGPGPSWRRWVVVSRHEETSNVASFLLRPADSAEAPAFQPGQYVSVAVTLPDGARQIRQYSLSNSPQRDARRITIKRVGDDGRDGEVSTWLHTHVHAGDVLTLSAPYGNVVIDSGDSPLLLASAGIGCTPVLGILDDLVTNRVTRQVFVVHADRSVAEHPLRWELQSSVNQLRHATAYFWYERPHPGWPTERTGFADLSEIDVPADLHAYLCGPVPFIESIRQQLRNKGIATTAIRHELFGPELAA